VSWACQVSLYFVVRVNFLEKSAEDVAVSVSFLKGFVVLGVTLYLHSGVQFYREGFWRSCHLNWYFEDKSDRKDIIMSLLLKHETYPLELFDFFGKDLLLVCARLIEHHELMNLNSSILTGHSIYTLNTA
jgi:hypothetical protein